ncbi:tetratricopeptide repeat protein [Arenimonas sp.]|uniref:tetratricopeptide repeat protein n=1 Tax=Arenimonas sp. TaxID=1872635 RepID=UPI0035B06DA8
MIVDIIEAMRAGDHAAALAAARDTLAAEPDNAEAHHLLGVCLQQKGDLAAARQSFDRALELAPDVATHHFSLATLKLSEGDSAGATRGLQDALALDPNQLGAYVLLAHMALAREDQAEARRNLRLAQRVNADHPRVRVVEGYLAQAEGDLDRSLKCFTLAAEADPNLAAAQLALGQAYLARGMWPFAEQALANALKLDIARAPSTLRGLVEARRRQGKAEETLAALDELIAHVPGDSRALTLRAKLRSRAGRGAEALADLRAALDANPAEEAALGPLLSLLLRGGQADEARQRADAAVQADPGQDALWKHRLNLATLLREDAKPLLDRWQQAMPESAACLELRCAWHDARGEHEQAALCADQALARNPDLYAANVYKLREEFGQDPALALARAERLLPAAKDGPVRRTLLGWRGMALDALGRHAEAAESWREMVRHPSPGQILPPPVAPADAAPAGKVAGRLVWTPPGVGAEHVLRQAKAQLGPKFHLERVGREDDGDGFGLRRFAPGHPEAGSAGRWEAMMRAAGLEPSEARDWLPHVDPYTLAALGEARVLVLLTDPRDALLNWMLHGSLQNYHFLPDIGGAAQWLASALEAVADEAEASGRIDLVRLDADAGDAAGRIEQALGLETPLSGLSGPGRRLPAGHWRHYQDSLAAEFAVLAPVAARLGYPAE